MDNKSCYTRWVLVPFWVLEVLFELLTIIFAALILVALQADSQDDQVCQEVYYYGYYYTECTAVDTSIYKAATGAAGADLGIAAVFLIMHIVQIVLYCKNRLSPQVNFGIELPRFIVWLIIWIFVLVVAARGGTSTSALFIVWPTLLFIFYLGSLIYASVIFHRYKTGYFGSTGATGVGREQEVFDMRTVQENKSVEPTVAPYSHPATTTAATHDTTDTRAPLAPYVSPDSHV